MRVRVYVSFKKTVLDPQGKTVCAALRGKGYDMVADVRQGKFFEITLQPGTDRAVAEKQIAELAEEVLANPVIEDFQVEFLD